MNGPSERLRVEIVRTRAELAGLQNAWRDLFDMTPDVSGFQSQGWLDVCGDHLPADSSLFVGVVWDDARPVAVFPTQLTGNGRLSFVGHELSNYCGPLQDPGHLEGAVLAWGSDLRQSSDVNAIDLSGLRGRSPFLRLVRDGLPGWGRPATIRTNVCPEVDLRAGWPDVVGRHKSKQRSTWKRKAARLGQLGELDFVEISDPLAIDRAMPRLIELYEKRWAGLRVRATFSSRREFHQEAAARLGEEGLALVSMLLLDGETIAFSYGIRGGGVTSSYVLAHDDRFDSYSPGQLLLLRILEASCRRGDPAYDFSLGDEPHKALWMTGKQGVYRALWGRGARPRAAWTRAWASARSVAWLRRLKMRGLRVFPSAGRRKRDEHDAPGLPAGHPKRWYVYRFHAGGAGSSLRRCDYAELRELLSPRLLRLALKRSFHRDEPLVVQGDGGPLGIVWRAATARRSSVAGHLLPSGSDDAVYYQPVTVEADRMERLVSLLAADGPCVVVTSRRLDLESEELGEFRSESTAWPWLSAAET